MSKPRKSRAKKDAAPSPPAVPLKINGTHAENLALPCISGDTVVDRKETWLSEGRLALGTLAILDGSKGSGKSTILARIAAAFLGGMRMPQQREDISGSVLWFAGEESLPRVKMKVAANGGSLKGLRFPGRLPSGRVLVPFSLPANVEVLEATIRQEGARLVVIDVLNSFVRGVDMNQDIPARSVVEPLAQMAEELGCLILATRHPRKTKPDNPIDRGIGGPAVAAVARSVLMTGRHPDTRGRVLGLIATNLNKPGKTLPYSIEDVQGAPVLVFGEEIDLDVERFETEAAEEHILMVRSEAELLLRKRVGDKWVGAKEVLDEARKAGISQDALDRARRKLGIPTRRVGKLGSEGHWEYGPPPKGWPEGLK
jgi:hypothetical protein